MDNALGAEEMLEELTEKNLSYSEEVEELKATIEDLENLQELADELEINHVQNEKEMQEELDFKDRQWRTLYRDLIRKRSPDLSDPQIEAIVQSLPLLTHFPPSAS